MYVNTGNVEWGTCDMSDQTINTGHGERTQRLDHWALQFETELDC